LTARGVGDSRAGPEPYGRQSALYLEDYSYKEIADILEVPLARFDRGFPGLAQLSNRYLRTKRTSPREMPQASATQLRREGHAAPPGNAGEESLGTTINNDTAADQPVFANGALSNWQAASEDARPCPFALQFSLCAKAWANSGLALKIGHCGRELYRELYRKLCSRLTDMPCEGADSVVSS